MSSLYLCAEVFRKNARNELRGAWNCVRLVDLDDRAREARFCGRFSGWFPLWRRPRGEENIHFRSECSGVPCSGVWDVFLVVCRENCVM